jgi:hypothetical protein
VSVGELLDRLDRVKRAGDGWQARCPAHEDRTPSLSIREGDDGRVLLKCHAGCSVEAIVDALGISISDLFAEHEARASSDDDRWTPHGPAIAIYRYTKSGRLLFEVCRTADKQFPQRRPDPTSKTGWRWNLDDVDRVLYHHDEVVAAVAERRDAIWLPEGEKHADLLRARGRVATTNPMGCKSWKDEYAETLDGAARVFVLADDDAPGRKWADKVARSLHGRVGEVRVVKLWPDGESGRDVIDFYAAAATPEEADRELVAIVESTPAYAPAPSGAASAVPDEQHSGLRTVVVDDFAAVDEAGADSILGERDAPVIPEGGDAMIYGDGGVGKTTLSIDFAFHLAAGDDWLGIPVPTSRRVLILENESPRPHFRRKLARKAQAWSGSPIDDRLRVYEHPWGRFDFTNEQSRQLLADEIALHEIDVVIVGPTTSVGFDKPGTIAETREFAALVDDVRLRSGRSVAFAHVHHENRAGKTSGAWAGVGDALLHVTQQGHGRLRLYFEKTKWSSKWHQFALVLLWADGDGFTIEDKPDLDDDALAQMIVDAIAKNPGTGWTRVEEQTPGAGDTRRRQTRDRLLGDGVIVNVAKDANGQLVAMSECPERKAAHLHLADDPTIRHLRRD